jgi:hypothetical protein
MCLSLRLFTIHVIDVVFFEGAVCCVLEMRIISFTPWNNSVFEPFILFVNPFYAFHKEFFLFVVLRCD